MPLGDTLKAYEKGLKLAEALKGELDAAQEKLTVLKPEEKKAEDA